MEESLIMNVASISSPSPQEGSSTSHGNVEYDEGAAGGDEASSFEEETEGHKKKKRYKRKRRIARAGESMSSSSSINDCQGAPTESTLKRHYRMKSPSTASSPGSSSASMRSNDSACDIEVVYDSHVDNQKSGNDETRVTPISNLMARTTESKEHEGPVMKCVGFIKRGLDHSSTSDTLDDSEEVQHLLTQENNHTEPTPSSSSVVIPVENELVGSGQIDGDLGLFGYPDIDLEDGDELEEFVELADHMHPVSVEELFRMIEEVLGDASLP